jgi:hypothetical protein
VISARFLGSARARRYLLDVPRLAHSPLVLVLSASLLGCEACGAGRAADPGPSEPAPPVTQAPEPEHTPEPPPTVEPTPEPPPSEPAPALTVASRVEGANVLVTIANDSGATVSFASELVLESHDTGSWAPVTARGHFVATLDATHPLPACAELVAGASLELSFPALVGTEPTEAAAAHGEHRFVLTSCNGTGRTEAAPFTVSP